MEQSIEHIFRRPEKTIRQIVDDFYQSSDFLGGKPLTQSQKRYELEGFCKAKRKSGTTYGDLPMRDLTFTEVDAFIVKKIDRPGACRALVKTLRSLVKFARKIGIDIRDPTVGLKLPALSPFGIREWTEEEIAIFETHYPIGTKERLAFSLALYTLLRREDLCILGPRHISNGVLYICPEKTRLTTGAFVAIPVHPALAEVLALVPEGQRTFVLNAYGRPFRLSYLSGWFIRACREAGLPKGLSLHGLRKAGCRRLAESGCTVHEIMAVSGHRTMEHVELYTRGVSWAKLARRAMVKVVRSFPTASDGTIRLEVPDNEYRSLSEYSE